MPLSRPSASFAAFSLVMALVVLISNILVQFPLGDWLTWGAFSYPFAFMVTELANRQHGPAFARRIVYVGFALAVVLSVWLATPRLAIASGTAFLIAQLLDIGIFNRLRQQSWWRAPLVASALASLIDTAVFFTLAFAATITILGPGEAFAGQTVPALGNLPRWIGWALGDLGVKFAFSVALLVPYRALLTLLGLPAFRAAPV
jgi:uncharacterized PurR-regulated membrane protein YhhQ (DUF165 family)